MSSKAAAASYDLTLDPNGIYPTEAEIKQLADEYGINLAEAYRPNKAYPILGWKHSQTAENVAAGIIPAPLPLGEKHGRGRAVAWTGRQLVIIIWQRLRRAAKRKQQVAA
jgi:hypothetical protein